MGYEFIAFQGGGVGGGQGLGNKKHVAIFFVEFNGHLKCTRP